jgi:heat shock protein HslJ
MKKTFKLLAVLLIIFSIINCKSKTNEPVFENNPEQLKRVWMLVEFKDYKRKYLVQKQALLDLTKNQNASANLGCITQSFLYSIKNNNSITFKEEIKINMKCKEMKLDIDFAKSIIDMSNYAINAHKLTLTSNNSEKMVFLAQDWD